jgi:hypothetical protein
MDFHWSDPKLWQIIGPVVVVQLILMVAALTALIKAEHTRGPKWVWAIVIVVVNIIGPIAFFLFGRRMDG